MERTEWGDERLTDLARIVVQNQELLQLLRNVQTVHDLKWAEYDRRQVNEREAREAETGRRWAAIVALVTVLVGQMATIVIGILELSRLH